MSLIDEALRKARLEAAQKDAERRGLPSPAASSGLPGRPAWRRSRRGPLTAGVIAAVVLVAISLGAGVYLGRRPENVAVGDGTPPTPQPVGVTAPGAAAEPAAGSGPASAASMAAPTVEPGVTEARTTEGPHDRGTTPDGGAPSATPSSPDTPEREEPGTAAGARGASPLEAGSIASEPGETGVPDRVQTAARPTQAPGVEPVRAPQNPPPATAGATTEAAPSTPLAPSTAGAPASGPSPPRKPPSSAAHGDADAGPVYRRQAPTASGGKLTLSGIAWRETDPVAVLNGEILGVGEGTAGYSITGIERDRVHLRGPEGTITIYLP